MSLVYRAAFHHADAGLRGHSTPYRDALRAMKDLLVLTGFYFFGQ